jgi:hypothetical protein
LPKFELNKTLSATGSSIRKIASYNPIQLRKRGTRAKALIALSAVCFLWGTTWLASKQGVKHMPALQMAGIRQLLGGSDISWEKEEYGQEGKNG